jgi:hypothetical protein
MMPGHVDVESSDIYRESNTLTFVAVHVAHDVDVGFRAETGRGEGQDPGIRIVSTRLEEGAAVPTDVGQAAFVQFAVEEPAAVDRRTRRSVDRAPPTVPCEFKIPLPPENPNTASRPSPPKKTFPPPSARNSSPRSQLTMSVANVTTLAAQETVV